MIDCETTLILPLVHHLVQQRVHCFFPSVAADVTTADDDLRLASLLSAPGVVAEPTFHPARNADGHDSQLPSEPGRIQRGMALCKLARQPFICWMRTFRTSTARCGELRIGVRARPRIQPERKLKLRRAEPDQASERSKHRFGPATKVPLSLDQMRVVTSMFLSPIAMTFTDEGLPPRDRDDTVPAVEITVPLRVCST